MCYNRQMQKKILRIIGLVMILMPFVYIPNIYKEILFVILGVVILGTTIPIKKKAL